MAHARSRAEGPSNTHHSQQKKEGEKKAVKYPREREGKRIHTEKKALLPLCVVK